MYSPVNSGKHGPDSWDWEAYTNDRSRTYSGANVVPSFSTWELQRLSSKSTSWNFYLRVDVNHPSVFHEILVRRRFFSVGLSYHVSQKDERSGRSTFDVQHRNHVAVSFKKGWTYLGYASFMTLPSSILCNVLSSGSSSWPLCATITSTTWSYIWRVACTAGASSPCGLGSRRCVELIIGNLDNNAAPLFK
jgi:hypothetical protein